MVRKFFPSDEMTDYVELTEGFFNVAYDVELNHVKHVILKIAPDKEMRVMTYEKNIMVSEVEAMRRVGEVEGIPAPKLLGFDDSRTICSSPYFFMERLKGSSLNSIIEKQRVRNKGKEQVQDSNFGSSENKLECDFGYKEEDKQHNEYTEKELTEQDIEDIYIEVGKVNRKINEIKGSYFGYPGQVELQGTEWFPVFHKMLEAGVKDAQAGQVDVKISLDELWNCLERDREIFDEVKEPKLVHWDCWDGNIFVDQGKLTGLIDWERCLYADPLMEVGFRTYQDNRYFQKGYGIDKLTEHQKCRAIGYDIYLLFLMSLECEYRQYDTMDMYYWTTELLQKQLEKIKQRRYD